MAFQVVDVLSQLTANATALLPNLLAAIILLVIGLVVGKILGRAVKNVLDKIRLDYYVSETDKPAVSLSNIFSVIAKWWIYLGFITVATSMEILGIPAMSLWVAEINAFIPRVIGAAAILIAGYVLAEYIKHHMKQLNKVWATLTAKTLFFLVMYVAVALALPILGVSATLVNNILLVVIASVGLGMAIALGLGLKDTVSDLSKRWAKKVKV
ncbi:MAG: hypothetical protein HYU56_00745 [Candidatus Aenigmarchaeota archaeon]|nr:hypothetical protein [Candidatus Aenigmarchaeota archaeon]